ncbi:hypothetical protein [Streptomyces sp. NPDC088135]|uniref:hypothetical protein n=1 Tax=Streptomyces sp. NPDC088135 TaxID=3160993 RepID=UPI003434F073
MDPTIGSAGIKAAGNISSTLLNRYRPVGVVRTGSTEDRAQAYRRFLDAATHGTLPSHWIRRLNNTSGTEGLTNHLLATQTEATTELICALDGIRLCAPDYVIAKAEDLMRVWAPNTEATQEEFPQILQATTNARMAFLDVARHDLNYEPKKWHLLARWKESRYLKKAKGASTQSVLGQ